MIPWLIYVDDFYMGFLLLLLPNFRFTYLIDDLVK